MNGNRTLVLDTQEVTILLINSIEFPNFGPDYARRNIENNTNTSCIYDTKNEQCPVFRVRTILEKTKQNYKVIARTGAVLAIEIKWNCDFSWGRSINDCKPEYSFHRKDNTFGSISEGFNYRCVHFNP